MRPLLFIGRVLLWITLCTVGIALAMQASPGVASIAHQVTGWLHKPATVTRPLSEAERAGEHARLVEFERHVYDAQVEECRRKAAKFEAIGPDWRERMYTGCVEKLPPPEEMARFTEDHRR